MSTVKKILRNDTLRRFLCWLGAGYIRLVHFSGKWTVVGGDIPKRFWDQGRPFIICFWHGRLLLMPYCWDRSKAINMLISQHPDGQLIARTVGHFAIKTIEGSTSRGGAAALRSMVKLLKSGQSVGITPDGPRGPRMRASDGIVSVAMLSGVPIIPATYAIDRRKVLSSWDRFIVAKPFGRGVIVWGEPMEVARGAGPAAMEAARARVEESLNAITAEADRMCGAQTIEPAEPAAIMEDAGP